MFPGEGEAILKGFINKKGKKSTIICIAVVIFIVLGIWIVRGNTVIEVTLTTIVSNRLPQSFSGYVIAHVSDLHNAEFGKGNSELLQKLEDGNPDIIVITGDLADSRHTDIDIAVKFANEAMKIAQVYYVTGNHEARLDGYDRLETGLTDAGVIVLRDEVHRIERSNEEILLIGLDDPGFALKSNWFGETQAMINAKLKNLNADRNTFSVLLSHRPELFEIYAGNQIDLVLSGHTHGGQIRLPFIGALVAPDQGFFPKYDAGLFHSGNTKMIVSRGLGNSIIPVRVNNRPELVIVTLEK